MGLFGKVFEKKVCDICGGEIGLLGNRKLDDGNLCKDCAKKLSPWFEERRHSTVEDIKKQLAYREANKAKVQAFQITREFAGDSYHVFIDDTKGQFTVALRFSAENNPDIVDLSQVVSCRLNIEQNRREEQYRDNEGNLKDYNPPRYKYSYDYSIKLGINSPWFDDMDFRLNSSSVDEHDRMKMSEMENTGNQIVAALTGMGYAPQAGGMYGQPVNGMQGGYGQPVNGMQGSYNQQFGAAQGGYGQQMNAVQGGYNQQFNGMNGNSIYTQQPNGIRCDKCGWVPEDPTQIPRFCPQCGDPIDGNDMR